MLLPYIPQDGPIPVKVKCEGSDRNTLKIRFRFNERRFYHTFAEHVPSEIFCLGKRG